MTSVTNNTIRCDSGLYFDLANPSVFAVNINDIASALSKICRFGGHCRTFYSVAEHSCHAAQIALDDDQPMECVVAVFLHDATEAYVGDMVKPLKDMLPGFKEVEKRVANAIGECFGIDFDKWHSVIREIDLAMLIAERRELFTVDSLVWVDELKARTVKPDFRRHGPEEAQRAFLKMWKMLGDICEGIEHLESLQENN